MRDIIKFFTKEGDLVLDYFMGVGGSLLGAALCGRRAVGIDLNQKYIEAYKNAANELNLPIFPTIQGDCFEYLKDKSFINTFTNNQKFSLILIDPPYGNMMSKEKTGGDISVYGNVGTPFTNDSRDLGNMTIDDCLESIKESIELAQDYLKKRGYIVVFIKDLQPQKKDTNILKLKNLQQIWPNPQFI